MQPLFYRLLIVGFFYLNLGPWFVKRCQAQEVVQVMEAGDFVLDEQKLINEKFLIWLNLLPNIERVKVFNYFNTQGPLKVFITDKLDPTCMGALGCVLIENLKPKMQLLKTATQGLDFEPLLAHEFFHMIHFILNPNEPAWVREGLADWFLFRVLRRFNGVHWREGWENIETSLIAEFQAHEQSHYGHAAMYFYYLWKECGGNAYLWFLVSQGLSFQPNHLKEQCQSFEQSVLNFELARVVNRVGEGENRTRFFLYAASSSMSYQGPTVYWSQLEEKKLLELELFKPLVFLWNNRDKNLGKKIKLTLSQLSQGNKEFKAYWIERIPPYRVMSIQETGEKAEFFSSTGWLFILRTR